MFIFLIINPNKGGLTMNKLFITIIVSSLLLTGCSTTSKSTLLGMSVGASTGAIAGATMAKDKKGALMGALVLGLIGGATGWFTHNSLLNRDDRVRRDTIFNLEKFDVQMPHQSPMDESSLKSKGKDVYIFTDNPRFFK